MKIIMKIIIIMLMSYFLFAGTTGKLKGLVKDLERNEPLIGCNIILEDTYLGTASNDKGEFIN